MNETPRKATVSLEDLLRLKRAERPPAEFWAEFERGMRTKQLAAIIEPRPWWAPFIKMGARVSRYQVPVGAAAILAITFLTVREYRTVELAPVYEPAVTAVVAISPAATESTHAVSASVLTAPAVPSAPLAIAEEPAAVAPSSVAQNAPSAPATDLVGSSSHVVPMPAELTPSARYIAENLAAAQAADPELDQMLGRSIRSLESRGSRVEPLAQVSVPGGSRRSRLMAGNAWLASVSSSGDSTLRTDDHSARRLSERRLSESDAISRIDVVSSRLTVKF